MNITRREFFPIGFGLAYFIKEAFSQEKLPTKEEFDKLEQEVISLAEKYASKTFEQFKNDNSLKPNEKFNNQESMEGIFRYASKPFDDEIEEGPFLEMFYRENALNNLLFVYMDKEKNESFALSFDASRNPLKEIELRKHDKSGIKFVIYSGLRYCKYQDAGSAALGPEFIGIASSVTAKCVNLSNNKSEGTEPDPNIVKKLNDMIALFEKNYGVKKK
jgi:hypothetical protein